MREIIVQSANPMEAKQFSVRHLRNNFGLSRHGRLLCSAVRNPCASTPTMASKLASLLFISVSGHGNSLLGARTLDAAVHTCGGADCAEKVDDSLGVASDEG